MSLFKKKKEDDADLQDIQNSPESDTPLTPDNPAIPQNAEGLSSDQDTEEELIHSADAAAVESVPAEDLPEDPVLRMAAEIRSAMESGEISEEIRTLLTHALNYQQDMDRAIADAELRGRNTAIEEHLNTMEQSDGVPHPGCGQGASPAPRHQSIFDLARSAR